MSEGYANTTAGVGKTINDKISEKINYLNQFKDAINNNDDRQIYRLLDNQRYASEIEHREQQENNTDVMNLVDDLSDQLSNYLSKKMINYLGKTYPFFYYEEYQTGHYRIYFGNWWDRRQFGELDVLNIRFAFNKEEYAKLAKSFQLSEKGKRYHSDEIDKISKENDHYQELIDTENKREQEEKHLQNELKDASSRSGLFESSKNREAREEIVSRISKLEDETEEARHAQENIKKNNKKVLELSKENTILSYEQKSIKDTFDSFEDFELANRNLYANYLEYLGKEVDDGKQVEDDD